MEYLAMNGSDGTVRTESTQMENLIKFSINKWRETGNPITWIKVWLENIRS